MKILILGAQGNLGTQLVDVVSQASDPNNPLDKNEVIAWDRSEIDITDQGLVKKKIADLKPDLIINAVAYNAVDLMESDEGFALAKKLNCDAVGYLAEASLENNATLIHFSTDYVFAGDKLEGYNENDEPAPISKYGLSKRMGEEQLIRLSGKGLRWYLIRTSKLFGEKGTSDVAKPSFFDMMIKLSKEKQELEVVDEEVSCFTYTVDLARSVWTLVQHDYGFGIYHIVNEGSATWYEAACELFKITKSKVGIIPVSSEKFPRPAKRPKFSVLNNNKFIKLRDYKEALREYLSI